MLPGGFSGQILPIQKGAGRPAPFSVFGPMSMDMLSLRNAIPDRIETRRLILRAPDPRDVPDIARLANNINIHQMTASMPYPYGEADAVAFVSEFARRKEQKVYAVTLKSETVVGVIGLRLDQEDAAELGYWFGEQFWGAGYGGEAAQALVAAVVQTGKCAAIKASARTENVASRRILERIGFIAQGERIASCGPHQGIPIAYYRFGAMEAPNE
jgi:RimJ/RimL family protein N-acetyltransferase